VYQSKNVTYDNIYINAHSYSSSPTVNSDGWDIYRSDSVTITNSIVNNGAYLPSLIAGPQH